MATSTLGSQLDEATLATLESMGLGADNGATELNSPDGTVDMALEQADEYAEQLEAERKVEAARLAAERKAKGANGKGNGSGTVGGKAVATGGFNIKALPVKYFEGTSKVVPVKLPAAVGKAIGLFACKLIKLLKQADTSQQSKGVHTVMSGFNAAMQAKFGLSKEQSWVLVASLADAGEIAMHPCKRGFMVYLPGDMPERSTEKDGASILAKLGL